MSRSLPGLLLAGALAAAGCLAGGPQVVHHPESDLSTWEVGEGRRAFLLLHGYGSAPREWLPFTTTIVLPAGLRFVFPQAPQSTRPPQGPPGGRAWWPLDLASYITDDRPVPDLSRARPRELQEVAARVQTLAREIERRSGAAPGSTVLAGHSQGGMIAGEIAFRSSYPMRALVLLSATIVDEASWLPGVPSRAGLPVFIAHGRADDILPFDVAERLAAHLRQHKLRVTWVPHDGGHDTPATVITALNAFLGDLD